MEKNESEKFDLSNDDLDKDNKFCSHSKNKQNKKEIKNQIINLVGTNGSYQFESNSYVLTKNKRLCINWNPANKSNLLNKYWIIKSKHKFDFFGKEIKNISKIFATIPMILFFTIIWTLFFQ